MVALKRANEIRLERAEQRRQLVGAPVAEVVQAILNPTPALAGIRLSTLLVPDNGHEPGVVPRIGKARLSYAFAEIKRRYPAGRHWHEALRLCDLSEAERQRLVDALLEQAPKSWAQGAVA